MIKLFKLLKKVLFFWRKKKEKNTYIKIEGEYSGYDNLFI